MNPKGLKELLNEHVWFNTNEINSYMFAIKNEYDDRCLGNVGVVWTFLYHSIWEAYFFWAGEVDALAKFEYLTSWINIVKGKDQKKIFVLFGRNLLL